MRKHFYFLLPVCLCVACDEDLPTPILPQSLELCGDGIVNNGEQCDGEAFAEGVKTCPNGLVVSDASQFTCSEFCIVDFLNACEPAPSQCLDKPVCGDGKRSENEPCDGTLFDETQAVCPSGYLPIEGRTPRCDASCELITASYCYPETENEPKLFISELYGFFYAPYTNTLTLDTDSKSDTPDLIYIEIANVGAETPLDGCNLLVGDLNADQTALDNPVAIPLASKTLGAAVENNSSEHVKNVTTVCYVKSEAFLTSEDTTLFPYDCSTVTSISETAKSTCYVQCLFEDRPESFSSSQWDSFCYKTCYADHYNYGEACEQNHMFIDLIDHCDVITTQSALALTRTDDQYQTSWGLALRCDARLDDIIPYEDSFNALGTNLVRICMDGDTHNYEKYGTTTPTGSQLDVNATPKKHFSYDERFVSNTTIGELYCPQQRIN